MACVDTRHFIEGFETGNFANDPYQVFPEVVDKVSVTVGIEHMGSMGGKWDPETCATWYLTTCPTSPS